MTLYEKNRTHFPETDGSRLKILFVSDAIAGRNGVGSYYTDLAAHLNQRVRHAELVSPGLSIGDHAHRLTFPLPGDATQRLYLPKTGCIWRKIRQIQPDVIVIPTPGPYGVLGYLAAGYLKIPLCSGYHTEYDRLSDIYWQSLLGSFGRMYMRGLNRLFFKASAVVVGNSEKMVEGAEKDGAKRLSLVGTPVARTFTQVPPDPVSQELSSVCYAGRLAPEKNIEAILAAARRLPGIRFTIAGDGPLRDMVLKEARRLSNVEFAGWVSRNGVKRVIDESDMLLLPSRIESFGTIALEAMARKRMVLVSENCGILNWPDLAAGVYAIRSHESLAAAIERISRETYSDRVKKTETGRAAALSFNNETLTHWINVLAQAARSAPPRGTRFG